jgi:two-component system sensor histidine kinase YcbA
MTDFRKKSVYVNILMISMISVLMGQFFISPPNLGFRLTLAVFFMSLFLLYFRSYNVLLITMAVGISTFLFRSAVYYLGSDGTFLNAVMEYLPVLSYYLFFGLFFIFFDVRKHVDQPFNFFMSLWVCDTIPNIIEASIRRSWNYMPFDQLIVTIAIVGLVRTTMTLIAYYSTKHYFGRFKKNEREKYFREIVVFLARLKTELFLLNKSRDDIENTMALGHELYDQMEDEEIKKSLIHIVKEIHEIKKDYMRVIAGMTAVFKIDTALQYMSIKDILDLVSDNLEKLASEKGKKIVIHKSYDQLFTTQDFYALISVLDNLTINSLEAIEGYGEVDIKVKRTGPSIIFEVRDTGSGIPAEKQQQVFNSGYTTKYDKHTGKMSTGVGLTHVRDLVSEYFGGEIEVESEVGKMTRFTLTIPIERLTERRS